MWSNDTGRRNNLCRFILDCRCWWSWLFLVMLRTVWIIGSGGSILWRDFFLIFILLLLCTMLLISCCMLWIVRECICGCCMLRLGSRLLFLLVCLLRSLSKTKFHAKVIHRFMNRIMVFSRQWLQYSLITYPHNYRCNLHSQSDPKTLRHRKSHSLQESIAQYLDLDLN